MDGTEGEVAWPYIFTALVCVPSTSAHRPHYRSGTSATLCGPLNDGKCMRYLLQHKCGFSQASCVEQDQCRLLGPGGKHTEQL